MEVENIEQITRVSERSLTRTINAAQSDVAQEAETLLGYQRRDATPLLVVLKQLDIQPLNAEQVAKYKKSKESRRKTRNNGWGITTIRTHWRAVKIAEYAGEIPMAILSKAVSIKKALPEVEFEIESLVETREKRQIRRLPDPFLVAKFGMKRIFIDVWDEPEFESKLYA